jgi:pimeloyl-ACP methyl ester carboxylesterase
VKFFKRAILIVTVIFILWAIINPFLFQFTTSDTDAKTAFSAKGMNIRTGDFKYKKNNLHYLRLGDTTKTVLLFVHGSPGCWDYAWDYFMDRSWQKDFELISIDRPGFGNSNYGTAKNLFEQSEIISAFVKEKLPHREVQLMGHSYGGPLVLQLCADNDSLYTKCIILAGSVNPAAEKNEWQLNLFSHPLLKWMVPGSFQQGLEELLWLKDNLKSDQYLKKIQRIKTPIVAIYGTKDNMVPYQPNVDFLQKNFSVDQLMIHTIQNGSHFIPWQNYEEIRNIVQTKKE